MTFHISIGPYAVDANYAVQNTLSAFYYFRTASVYPDYPAIIPVPFPTWARTTSAVAPWRRQLVGRGIKRAIPSAVMLPNIQAMVRSCHFW